MSVRRFMALYPVFCSGRGVTLSCLRITKGMENEHWESVYWCEQFDPELAASHLRTNVPRLPYRIACKLGYRGEAFRRQAERGYLSALEDDDVPYIWPAVSLDTYKTLKKRGFPIVCERINNHRAAIRRIIGEAYERLGLPPEHGVTEKAEAIETEKLHLADWIYAPSEFVRQSFRDAGVPNEKLLPSHFGCELPAEGVTRPPRSKGEPPVFLFAGLGGIRKGLPWLLKAWKQAGIRGRLRIAGRIEPVVKEHFGDLLEHEGVEPLGFVTDMPRIYREADVFVFPTIEEGSPLVIYEAMSYGLPCITTPMGGGDVMRHGKEGRIVENFDVDGLAAAMSELAADMELREAFGQSALERIPNYTWDAIGQRRREAVEGKV